MSQGIVSAGHQETAQAAVEILHQGGNAFDAIVGAAFAACAAEPVLTSLGGGGFMLAHNSEGKERLYDFFVQTPHKKPDPKSLDFFPIHADFGRTTQEFHIGMGSMATPGTIAGLFEIHSELGSMPMTEVIRPAVAICREGILINQFQEYLFSVIEPIYSLTEDSRRIYGTSSHPEKLVLEGDVLKFPELADTMEALAREGSELFYKGELAHRLVKQNQDGGTLKLKDLSAYRVIKRDPFEFHYQGHRIITNPPPSCGGILIAFCLELLENNEIEKAKPGSREDLIYLAHAMELTNKARLDALSQDSNWENASKTLFKKDFLDRYRQEINGQPISLRGTTHLNVIDKAGNVASMSLSNGEGCGHLLKGTGIVLNNMLGEEDLSPGGFHAWPTNQRLTSMMAPTLMFHSDGTRLAMGSGGSNRIRTAIVQVLRNIADYGMSVPEAVGASRIHFERGLLSVEPGFAEEVVRALAKDFPNHHLWKEKNLFFGGVHTVALHENKSFEGAGDPRRAGVCLKV